MPMPIIASLWLILCSIEAIGASALVGTPLLGAVHAGVGIPGMVVAIVFLSVGFGAFKTAVILFIGK